MTVQELGDTLTKLVGLLQAADAKATTTRGLSEFIESIAPFGDLSLKAFVKLAEVGRTPLTPASRPVGKSKADPAAIAAEVKVLYDRAADPTVAEEEVRAACGRLAVLTKNALVQLADTIELFGMKAKTKGDILTAITDRLLDRKGAAIRRQLIDRPATPNMSKPSQDAPAELVTSETN